MKRWPALTLECLIMPCLDNLGDFTPKLNTTKKLVILNGSINAIWYLLHLPLVAYVIAILAVQKEHTVVIDNSPFLQLIVNAADNAPYLNADVVLPADIAQYCASAGGPFPCKNSTTEVYKQCAAGKNQDVLFVFRPLRCVFQYMSYVIHCLC